VAVQATQTPAEQTLSPSICEQSSFDSHAVQTYALVSQREASAVVQSVLARQPTQVVLAVSQTGVGSEQLVLARQPTQVLVPAVSQTDLAASLQSEFSRQLTHALLSELSQ